MIMITASEAIWGEKRACRGLQRVLVELMHNTNNHASTRGKGEKHWWLSVNRNKALKKVEFAFLDHGVGIFSSLREKDGFGKWHGWQEKIKKVFGMTTDEENLRLLLEGKIHLTVTGSTFRGKGLPGIKEVLDRNQISNLQIITNNVSADVANNKYNLLSNVYRGTFFYWELDSTNENQKWNIC